MELQNAKGVRDFPPEDKILRDSIINNIKEVLEIYGFNPIELPILERYETLAAKYAAGDASDALKEIFITKDNGNRKLGLRFDLTVPFARFVGMNPDLKMPFKKYVLGNVFRDGPIKKGRYREFLQFDPDVVGCKSVLADAEIIALVEEVFAKLGLEVEIKFNNRKLLFGILEDLGLKEKDMLDAIISIDKLDKIGKKGVSLELKEKGFSNEMIERLFSFFEKERDNKKTILKFESIKSNIGKEGISEIKELLDYLDVFEVKSAVFTPSLARGLAYYTGPIFEAYLKNSDITSSVAGGGRYDEIIGKFLEGKRDVPATGVSFGVDVILEALRGKKTKKSVAKVFVIPIKTQMECIKILTKLRKEGIPSDMDLIGRGISHNLDYANYYEIPYVVFVGQKELSINKVKLRDMKTGEEKIISLEELISFLKNTRV